MFGPARFVLPIILVGVVLNPCPAENKPIPAKYEFKGSVEDAELAAKAPGSGVIVNAKAFDALWESWKVEGKKPTVDFTRELVVVATTRGSRLMLSPSIDENGDLKVLALSTKDLRPGFRYMLVVVERNGIKTVGGKELPRE